MVRNAVTSGHRGSGGPHAIGAIRIDGFTLKTGQSPATAIERPRLEAARLMIERSRHPLDVIAKAAGFRDRRCLRDASMRGFGVPSLAIRRRDEREMA